MLKNSPHVSDERRSAVLAAMAELGYRPDPIARSLTERRTRTIGVVVDDLANPWYVGLLQGLRPVLHEHGLRPLLADGRTEPDAVEALSDLRVDGMVVVGTATPTAIVQARSVSAALPIVVAGTREPLLSTVDLVANDDDAGARAATRHLIGLGHRRIAHVAGEGEVGRIRLAGYEGEMARAGLTARSVPGDWTEATGHARAREILVGPDRPTAVLAANDLSAIGVLTAADELGLDVPGDLSIVGYDDTFFARMQRLSLSTIDPRTVEIGRAAGEVLTGRLDGDAATPTMRLLAPRLVVRRSTGPVPV
ncbi:LacI family DNA-binding transcriptional regulator [Pseudonocardia yuanmonensis]|uniref:LacI family DNA-binding transcriptional regulator n=1 Tax=Pseudonocardia yuanmonensis TaxID=1095914 RepID=A0ABP8WEL5_9PSEU